MNKGIGYVIALVLAILGSLIGIHLVSTVDTLKKENFALSKDKEIRTQSLLVERKRSGELSAKVEALNVDYKGAKALLHSKDDYLVQIVRDYEIKLKDLRTAVNVKSSIEREIKTQLRNSSLKKLSPKGTNLNDSSIDVKTFEYIDEWTTVKGIIKGDSITIRPTFKNDQDILTHMQRIKKRYWLDFFPPKQMMVEVINRNPYSSVYSLKAIVSNPRKKFLGIF
jgi:hypothetical protein